MKYYATQRPAAPGTVPNRQSNPPTGIMNYPERTYVPEIKRMAWGEITYLSPLSQDELEDYELTPSPANRTARTFSIPCP